MPTPLSTTDHPSGGARRHGESESHAWQELEDVFSTLSQLARSPIAPQEFYRSVLDESVRALSAAGGAVWLRAPGGPLQPIAQTAWPRGELLRDEEARRDHEALLTDAAANGRVAIISPGSGGKEQDRGNPTDHVLVIGPVQEASQTAEGGTQTQAIIELLLRAGAGPAVYRGCEQFLTGVCELAADYHAFGELRRLRQSEDYRSQLLRLGRDAHRQLKLSETAYTVANEGRGVVGCDRLSVLVAKGRRGKLLAVSGASRIKRRSGAARRLKRVADLVRRTDEPAFYADGQSDALPPVAEALEKHAEESHARQIAAIPLRWPVDADEDEHSQAARPSGRRRKRPQFVLVAEQFDARTLDRDRMVEVAEVCTTALYNALEYDRLPLTWLMRPLGAVKQQVVTHFPRTILALAAIAGAVAALILVQADFNIEAPGTLQPIVRRDVFAPRTGLVDEVLAAHGAEVAAGEPLVRMRDASLDLELKRVDGELQTAQRQLDAVRATRTTPAVRDANLTEASRLSAEERELQQRLTNLRRELELLSHERDQLVVTSPIAGRVLTWDIGHRLGARPVERGEVLVSVADLSAEWQLELDVPDDQIGYVFAAQQDLRPDLSVRFRLSSDDREQHEGHIVEICQTADVKSDDATSPSPSVLVKVALDKLELSEAGRRELRPGVSARAQIACGRAPIGYVWLHDIWDAAIEWLRF